MGSEFSMCGAEMSCCISLNATFNLKSFSKVLTILSVKILVIRWRETSIICVEMTKKITRSTKENKTFFVNSVMSPSAPKFVLNFHAHIVVLGGSKLFPLIFLELVASIYPNICFSTYLYGYKEFHVLQENFLMRILSQRHEDFIKS